MKYTFMRFPEGKTKAVTFSYDDACRDDIRLAQTLDAYGMKGTFNIPSGWIAKESGGHNLTEEEIREHIQKKGHEIATHGQWHMAMGLVRPIDGIQDVLNCRLELEERFGGIIRGMAYSDSGILDWSNQAEYSNVKQFLKNLDIVYSRTLGGDNNRFQMPNDWYNWVPTAHHDNPQILEWAKQFTEMDVTAQYDSSRHSKLFYVWGHAFEFGRNGNWERLTELCKALAHKEDVWYATNIEIYEYAEAYHSLVSGANGKRIYNPTLKEIWFEKDKTLYSIKSGETLEL